MLHSRPTELPDPRLSGRRLARRLGLFDAVVIGLGSMIGAGVFAAALAASTAPLAAAVGAGADWLTPAVRIGGTVAALGVLLSLLAGVSRTGFAMASNADFPRWLKAVHPAHRVPHRAELTAGALVAGLVLVADLRGAIGFSSFGVLTYYAIANASAWTLAPGQRRWPRPLAAAGLFGCVVLAFTLPMASIVTGAAVLGSLAVIWLMRTLCRRRTGVR